MPMTDSVGTLTDILPSPAWSRNSRRQRAPILNTFMSLDSTVPLDHVTEKSSVDILSTDEVPLDLCSSRSDYTVTLDQCITEKCVIENVAPALKPDRLSVHPFSATLDPLSSRSVILAALGPLSSRSFVEMD